MYTQPDIDITLIRDFLAPDEQRALFSRLVADIAWQDGVAGKSASFGGPLGTELPAVLQPLRQRVAARLGWQPNACTLDYFQYRAGRIPMRTEDVGELDPDTAVAIVSLGAPRLIMFERHDGSDAWARPLDPGALVVLPLSRGDTWRHGIPARAGAGPRVGVTLRRIVAEPARATG